MTSEKKSVPEILKLKNASVRDVSTHAITHTHPHKHISKQTYVGTRDVSEFFCTWCVIRKLFFLNVTQKHHITFNTLNIAFIVHTVL